MIGVSVEEVSYAARGMEVPKSGGKFAWDEASFRALLRRLDERSARRASQQGQPPHWSSRLGLTTGKVVEELGLSYFEFVGFLRGVRHKVKPEKISGWLRWSEEDLAVLRAELEIYRSRRQRRLQAETEGRTGPVVATSLGIAYSRLVKLAHCAGGVEKVGGRIVWTDELIAKIRDLLRQEAERPDPQAPGSISTKEVARKLGLSYSRFLAFLRPHRDRVKPQKIGGFLAWSEADVEILRQSLTLRSRETDRRRWSSERAMQHKIVRVGEISGMIGQIADHKRGKKKPELVRDMGQIGRFAAELSELAKDIAGLSLSEVGFIHSLPSRTFKLVSPLRAMLLGLETGGYEAQLPEVSLRAEGATRKEALDLLRSQLWTLYSEQSQEGRREGEIWQALDQMIAVRVKGPAAPDRAEAVERGGKAEG